MPPPFSWGAASESCRLTPIAPATLGQCCRLRIGQIFFHVPPFEHLDVEEAKCADVYDNCVDGQLPVSEKVRVIALQVVGSDLFERSAYVMFEMFDRSGKSGSL